VSQPMIDRLNRMDALRIRASGALSSQRHAV
jgi:hypothetical protein